MHWIFSLSSWLKCSQSLSESLVALLKIALCSETENKMSWQTKHLYFLDKYLSWLDHREGPGEWPEGGSRPTSGGSMGFRWAVGKTHWHLTSVKASGWLKGGSFVCWESKRWLVCRDSLFSVLLHSVILTPSLINSLGLDICKWIPL